MSPSSSTSFGGEHFSRKNVIAGAGGCLWGDGLQLAISHLPNKYSLDVGCFYVSAVDSSVVSIEISASGLFRSPYGEPWDSRTVEIGMGVGSIGRANR
jgi:hypothetical protein